MQASAFATVGRFLDKPCIETDWEGNIFHLNASAQHLFGLPDTTPQVGHINDYLPKSTVVLHKIVNLKPPADAGIITLVEAADTEGHNTQGDPLTLEVSVLGTTLESGSRLLFLLRILHAPKLQSRLQLISRLLNQAKIPMSIIDEAGYFIEVNQSFIDLFGYAFDEITGKLFTLLISPSNRRRAQQLHKSFFQTEKELQAEWEYVTATGNNKTVMVTANLLTSPHGQRLQLRTYQDITAHIDLERHFQQNEALMHHIFDFAEVGIALVNDQGITSHANHAFCTLFGYRSTEIIEQPFNRIFNIQQRDFAHKRYQDAMNQEYLEEDMWKIMLPHGTSRYVRTLFRRLTFPDGVTRLLIIASDITIDKNIRAQLIQDKEAAELKLLRTHSFMTMISHKLRTLVNPIAGFIDLLKSTSLNDEQRDYTDSTTNNCALLQRFAEDIIEFTRADSDTFSPRQIAIDLNHLLQSTKHDLTALLQRHNVKLYTRLSSDCATKIKSEPLHLRSLVNKLATHAITHTFGNRVSIDIKSHSKDAANREAKIAIHITQKGSRHDLRQINNSLQNFIQLSSSVEETSDDFTLNLAICKSLATSIGASLHCDSDLDDALRFTVRFDAPLASSKTSNAAAANLPPRQLQRPLRIICADDSPSSLRVMQGLLGRMGHQITLVPSAAKLMEHLCQQDFDIVCLDLNMPAMNGFEVCEQIRAGKCNVRNANIQIIAITAHDSAENHQKCLDLGMNGYVTKPIDRNYLARVLNACRRSS